nr:hypothetical protein B0A51_16581 [Rachicladosporium sp. CCFEE 5018]
MEPTTETQQPLLDDDSSSDSGIEMTRLHNGLPSPSLLSTQITKPVPILHIALALLVTIAGFVINTESAAYYEDVLGWKKPFCSLYIMHSSLALPWACHLLYSRLSSQRKTYKTWVRDYNNDLRAAIAGIEAFATAGPAMVWKRSGSLGGPLDYLATAMALVTVVLTVSGMAWFVALVWTTPGDLTAIYNCSTFFAAVFSVPLLRQKLSGASTGAVALSIIGTFIIAYGDTTAVHTESEGEGKVGTRRLLGNVVSLVGAVAFGLYEVLFKKYACSSRPAGSVASLHLTFAASALTGMYTFSTFWVVLLVLHIVGIETFVIPSLYVALWIAISVLSGAIAMTSLLILVTWTNPVFSSVASVLSVFFVAIADWLLFGLVPSVPTYAGGLIIIVAFVLMAKEELGHGKR